jgi:hypothetical protein
VLGLSGIPLDVSQYVPSGTVVPVRKSPAW